MLVQMIIQYSSEIETVIAYAKSELYVFEG